MPAMLTVFGTQAEKFQILLLERMNERRVGCDGPSLYLNTKNEIPGVN